MASANNSTFAITVAHPAPSIPQFNPVRPTKGIVAKIKIGSKITFEIEDAALIIVIVRVLPWAFSKD